MTEQGAPNGGRRRKRFLSPSQKYEIWIGLLRGESTISEAADRAGVDRSTVMKKKKKKIGSMLAEGKGSVGTAARSRAASTRPRRPVCSGSSTRRPRRAGSTAAPAAISSWPSCVRGAGMSAARRAAWKIVRPAGMRCMVCSPRSVTRSSRCSTRGARRIVRIASSRIAALTSSWVSVAGDREACSRCKRAHSAPAAPRWQVRAPIVSGVATYTKHSIWIYDVTHFAGCPRVAVITIMDLVTRKWICEVVSGEETSTQIQAAFCDALELEGLDAARRRTPRQHHRSPR